MPNSLVTNCVAWWTFSQTNRAGTQYTYNVTREVNDLTVSGAVYSNANNGALYFDGIDDVLTGTTNMCNGATNNGFTVLCWAKSQVAVNGYGCLVTKFHYAGSLWSGWGLIVGNDGSSKPRVEFYCGTGSATAPVVASAPDSVPNNQWKLLCGIISPSGDANVFINGILSSFQKIGLPFSGIPAQTNMFSVGKTTGFPAPYTGLIDMPMFFDRALSSNEQYEIYTTTKGAYGL